MGQALPSVISASAVPGGGSLTEVTVLQPVLMGQLAYGPALRGRLTLDFEGLTGLVPFGTDDPMSRPFVRFPVNHHLAQIVERAEIATGCRRGPCTRSTMRCNWLWRAAGVGVQPFVEVTFGQVNNVGGGLFDAAALYGTNDMRGLTVGMRSDFGGRMGRYGAVAVPDEQVMGHRSVHVH